MNPKFIEDLNLNEHDINDEILVKYLLGEAATFERSAVEAWINAADENKKYFEHFQLIWEESKKTVIPDNVNAEDAWLRFKQRTEQASKEIAVVKPLTYRRTWIRAASIGILIAGLTALTYFLSDLNTTPVTFASSNRPVTDTLPDGSQVTLNRNSSISYSRKFKGDQRKVQLKGEAFFTVTPDKNKPFIINVNDITVTVVGTSFNVKSIGDKTQVVVESGIVTVTKDNETVELRPREKVLTRRSDTALIKEGVTDQLHQYYRTKEFVCDRTPLWKLVEVLNEAYDANITIGNDKLRSLPLTTTFYNQSLDKILSVIAETFEISVERSNGQVILK